MEKISVESSPVVLEMDRLRQRHSYLEKRLHELARHLSLSPDEQWERARLKKEKLATKDRLAWLARPTS